MERPEYFTISPTRTSSGQFRTPQARVGPPKTAYMTKSTTRPRPSTAVSRHLELKIPKLAIKTPEGTPFAGNLRDGTLFHSASDRMMLSVQQEQKAENLHRGQSLRVVDERKTANPIFRYAELVSNKKVVQEEITTEAKEWKLTWDVIENLQNIPLQFDLQQNFEAARGKGDSKDRELQGVYIHMEDMIREQISLEPMNASVESLGERVVDLTKNIRKILHNTMNTDVAIAIEMIWKANVFLMDNMFSYHQYVIDRMAELTKSRARDMINKDRAKAQVKLDSLQQTIQTLEGKIEAFEKQVKGLKDERKLLEVKLAEKSEYITHLTEIDYRNESVDRMYSLIGQLDKFLQDTEREKDKQCMTLGNISEMMIRTKDIVQYVELTPNSWQTDWTIMDTTPGFQLGTFEPVSSHPISEYVEKFRRNDKIDVSLQATDDEVLKIAELVFDQVQQTKEFGQMPSVLLRKCVTVYEDDEKIAQASFNFWSKISTLQSEKKANGCLFGRIFAIDHDRPMSGKWVEFLMKVREFLKPLKLQMPLSSVIDIIKKIFSSDRQFGEQLLQKLRNIDFNEALCQQLMSQDDRDRYFESEDAKSPSDTDPVELICSRVVLAIQGTRRTLKQLVERADEKRTGVITPNAIVEMLFHQCSLWMSSEDTQIFIAFLDPRNRGVMKISDLVSDFDYQYYLSRAKATEINKYEFLLCTMQVWEERWTDAMTAAEEHYDYLDNIDEFKRSILGSAPGKQENDIIKLYTQWVTNGNTPQQIENIIHLTGLYPELPDVGEKKTRHHPKRNRRRVLKK